jgi:hypothetical protein
MNDRNWKSEFQEFRNGAAVRPPREVSERIYAQVERDLNVSAWGVFSKLSLIHAGSALFTLSICPQFGFRAFGEGMGLMHYFMSLGTVGCPLACGAFFLGMSLLLATLILSAQELRVLRSHRWAGLGALTLLSLGFFLMADPVDIVASFAIAWVFGAVVGGYLVLELGAFARAR